MLHLIPNYNNKNLYTVLSRKNTLKLPNGYLEDVNRRRTDNTMIKYKGQNVKQRFTKHYQENKRSSNTNHTKNVE